jgi:hypothetical protein
VFDFDQRTKQVLMPRSFFKATIPGSQTISFNEYPVISSIDKPSVVWNIIQQLNIRVTLPIVTGQCFRQMNIGAGGGSGIGQVRGNGLGDVIRKNASA